MENQLPIYSLRGVIYSKNNSQFNYGQTGIVSTPVPSEPPYALQSDQQVEFTSDCGVSAPIVLGEVWFDELGYNLGLYC